jgi:triosephosphate isomerase (TIM)
MRRHVIAGNWKMNKTLEQGVALIRAIKNISTTGPDIIVCPPFTHLSSTAKLLKDTHIKLGAQNMSEHDSGAFTGEISAAMLQSVGVKYVILGHSERRTIYNESNSLINTKIKRAMSYDLSPIFCVGETYEEREADRTFSCIETQVREGLSGLSKENLLDLDTILAYEPVWAIGTGKVASPLQAQDVHAHIRNVLSELYDQDLAQSLRIQYGGSVKPDNAKELLSQPDIDGALVGGACLDSTLFAGIINA